MRDLGKIVGHIPARGGSIRVKSKNLRYLAGRPLLTYSIEAALASGLLDEVVVNTDDDQLAALAIESGAKVFRRDPELASATASGDAFTYDFIKKYPVDTLVMISPVCPLVGASDIRMALDTFRASDADTLITTCESGMQAFTNGEPVNIDLSNPLAPTQNNPSVHTLNWAVTIWDCEAYVRNYEKEGYAYIGKNRVFLPIEPLHGVKISDEKDFRIAEALLLARSQVSAEATPTYWPSHSS